MTTRSGLPRGALPVFVKSTRGAATAVTAAMISIAAFLGVGLAGDYLRLTGQRDVLKGAANAATIAAIKHFADLNISGVDDEELDAVLRPVVERYLLANIPPEQRERVRDTLELTIDPNRASRTVNVSARADLGGLLFLGAWVDTGVFRVATESGGLSDSPSTEVVLAIDVTTSMFYTIEGDYPPDRPDYGDYPSGEYPFTKMNIVKAAALELVDILNPDGNGAAIGVVPWHYRVRLGKDQHDRWMRENWARYLQERTYPRPVRGAPSGGEVATMPLEADREPWTGCFDQRSASGSNPPALSPVPPWDTPFTMSYYTHKIDQGWFIGFECQPSKIPPSNRWNQHYCYDPNADAVQFPHRLDPQDGCSRERRGDIGKPGHMVPLTTNDSYLETYIGRLRESGSSTYSAIGMVWALRMLDPVWQPVWGDPDLPRATAGGSTVAKAIILLTDGDDNYGSNANVHLRDACVAAKAAGVRIFIVAAMQLDLADDDAFIKRLQTCSSNDDYPEAEHVFVNNSTPEMLRASFRTIARQLQPLRLTK